MRGEVFLHQYVKSTNTQLEEFLDIFERGIISNPKIYGLLWDYSQKQDKR